MKKRQLVLHSVTILAIVLFAFLAIGSAAVSSTTRETTSVSSEISSEGNIYNMPPPNGGVSGKSYTTLGLVFATSVMEFDEKGMEISNQEGIVIMLLREAEKLGGNDILNLRTDETVTYEVINSTGTSSSSKKPSKKTVTTTGSALAIKYYD